MLILTRQEGEKIYIGDKIVVEITRYNNERVRLGINAPPEKVVLRGELHEALKPKADTNSEKAMIDVPSEPILSVVLPTTENAA